MLMWSRSCTWYEKSTAMPLAMSEKVAVPLSAATTVFEGATEDVRAFAYSVHTPWGRYDLVDRIPTFFTGEHSLLLGERRVRLNMPDDVNMRGNFQDKMVLSLRSPWEVDGKTYPLAAPAPALGDYMAKDATVTGTLAGNIIVRQLGTKILPGTNVGLGRDYTIYSLIEGQVKFETKHGRKYVSVYPVEQA